VAALEKDLSVARGGDVDHPEIDPEYSVGSAGSVSGVSTGRVEPERPVSVDRGPSA